MTDTPTPEDRIGQEAAYQATIENHRLKQSDTTPKDVTFDDLRGRIYRRIPVAPSGGYELETEQVIAALEAQHDTLTRKVARLDVEARTYAEHASRAELKTRELERVLENLQKGATAGGSCESLEEP